MMSSRRSAWAAFALAALTLAGTATGALADRNQYTHRQPADGMHHRMHHHPVMVRHLRHHHG